MVGFQDEICRLQSIVKSRAKKPVENCDDAKPTFKSLHTGWQKSYICAQLLVLLWDLMTRYM